MKALVLLIILLSEFYQRGGSRVLRPKKNEYETRKWRVRLESAVSLMRAHPCVNSQTSHNCNRTPRIALANMNVYIASKSRLNERLSATLPDRKHRSLVPNDRNIDGVIVIDPYPEANFGHIVYIFFVEEHRSYLSCTRNLTATFTGTGDCIIAATKSHCKNAVSVKKRKKCYIDFLPLVFSEGDTTRTQRLSCQDGLFGFGKCRNISSTSSQLHCANSPRCLNIEKSPKMNCFYKRCDYAVLVSGGWSPLTAHPRHEKNVKKFWNFLRENQFEKENIATFYGKDGKIDLDGDESTKDDAMPAVKDVGISDYISKLCRSPLCVDTLVLYLTGPARSNGALLMWDINGDGLTENAEMYSVHEIFKSIRHCFAKRVYIVADYSYSGHLAHRLQELKRHRHKEAYKHVTVVTSSGSNEYSWRNEFTNSIVKYGQQNATQSVHQIFKNVKNNFQTRRVHSTPRLAQGYRKTSNLTFYGGKPGEHWKVATNSSMGCHYISITEYTKAQELLRRHKGLS